MGSPISQVQAPQTGQPQGKGGPVTQVAQQAQQPAGQSDGIVRPMGKGGRITFAGQTDQPQMGQPNNYSNTVGPWDNASIGNQRPQTFGSAKGKGA